MSDETSQPSTETTEPAETEATTETTVEGTNGETAITSYLDGKYDSVSALESGYKELQSSYSKKLGAFTGAPEEYTLGEGIEANSRIEALQEWGKENQLSNDALNSIITLEAENTQRETEAYIQGQKELLGKDADARLNNIQDWARANLGEDNMADFNSMITTAKGVEMFEAISKMNSGTTPAPANTNTVADKDTVRQMRFAKDEYGNRRMSTDANYRARVEEMESQILANGGKL